MVQGRRNSTVLATVIGTVLAGYAGGASALEFEFDNGVRVNWNTTLSVGASWRAEDQSRLLYTRSDGGLIGRSSGPLPLGTPPRRQDGLAGNQAASSANLNYNKDDIFSLPFKLLSDVEVKKGNFGGLLRIKAWYDYSQNSNEVWVGNQANDYNGARPGLGPYPTGSYGPCTPATPAGVPCLPFSSPGVNRWPRDELSDTGFEDEQKFDNLMLLDAYIYGSFDVGDTSLQLRLGNQVVNWGESVFIQGVNQINPIDVPAARRAGAELKEILLPVWMAYANWGFDFGSVEAFYQIEWNNTSVDGCGTYWATVETIISTDPGRCQSATVITNVLGGAATGTVSPLIAPLGSNPFAQGNGLFVPLVKGKEPSNSGQFGLAFRFPVDAIDTEFGLYGMNIHSRLPIISGIAGTLPTTPLVLPPGFLGPAQTSPYLVAAINPADGLPFWRIPGTGANPLDPNDDTTLRGPTPLHQGLGARLGRSITPGRAFWEYPEDIQIFGLSAATNLFGWSVSAEYSYQADVPVQVNGNDLLQSLLGFVGPNAQRGREAALKGAGTVVNGYDQFNKNQFQVNTVKTFSNLLWSDNLLLIGEIGYQWNNVPDYKKGAVRYGRGFMYGVGSNPDLATQSPVTGGNTCTPTLANPPPLPPGVPVPASPVYNPSPLGCRNDGYITDSAWGYRLRVSADYLNVFNSGIAVTPSVFWSQDVDGISIDPAFIEDREVLGLGMKFTYNKKYVLDLNWVDYADNNYDPLHDRDYYSAAFSVTF
jgi:hypothetical protein